MFSLKERKGYWAKKGVWLLKQNECAYLDVTEKGSKHCVFSVHRSTKHDYFTLIDVSDKHGQKETINSNLLLAKLLFSYMLKSKTRMLFRVSWSQGMPYKGKCGKEDSKRQEKEDSKSKAICHLPLDKLNRYKLHHSEVIRIPVFQLQYTHQ